MQWDDLVKNNWKTIGIRVHSDMCCCPCLYYRCATDVLWMCCAGFLAAQVMSSHRSDQMS